MGLDGMADIAQRGPGAHLLDALPQRVVGGVDEASGLIADVPDAVHLRRVGNVAALFQGDVDVDDRAFLQYFIGIGHAMAHHMVHRGIERIRKAVLAFARRPGLERVDDECFGTVVDLHRGHAGADESVEVGENLGQQLAGAAHQVELGGGLENHLGHGGRAVAHAGMCPSIAPCGAGVPPHGA
ncbi:hypothetical protein D3C81_1562530 [compost metagenome]